MIFIVEKAASVAQWLFLVYFLVVGFNMYKLFSPPQCGPGDPPEMCVPSAIGVRHKYDLWVWASPEKDFGAIADFVKGGDYAKATVHDEGHEPGTGLVQLVHCAFGLFLNESVEANITVPVSKFATRLNGTLYMHAVLHYPTPKFKEDALFQALNKNWKPSQAPLAVVSSAFTKKLFRVSTNYSMLLGDFKDTLSDTGSGDLTQVSGDAHENADTCGDAGTCDAASATDGSCLSSDTATDAESALRVDTTEEIVGSSVASLDTGDEKIDASTTPVAGPVTHLRPRLTFFVVSKPPTFDRRKGMPSDLPIKVVRAGAEFTKLGHKMAYAPLLLADDVTVPRREYIELSSDLGKKDPFLLLRITPMHIGLFRLTHQMTSSLKMMSQSFGLTESDLDDVKELFTGHDWRWMAVTCAVSLLHSWFAFLAFRHDIGFWKQKSNLEGLSVRTQWSTFVCQGVIFANLVDTNQASTIILAEMGISVAIEGWKVSKFLVRDGFFYDYLRLGPAPKQKTQMQVDVDVYDKKAMYVLSVLLYPIVLIYGGYSLMYNPQRSWRSWILRTLANGVYMFGFIAMTPQLYVNYKLKSVAHMPWRAFMYKTFNTFIDDVFAFAVTMPLIHRIACLRDDLVFFVYLYQRRIYPVDKKRVNEFGRAYEEDEDGEVKEDESAAKDDAKSDKKALGESKKKR